MAVDGPGEDVGGSDMERLHGVARVFENLDSLSVLRAAKAKMRNPYAER